MIDLRICVYCSFHQTSLNFRGHVIRAFLIFLMCPKSYRSWRIIFQLGSQLWMFLSLPTTLLVFSPTHQIYSTCFLTNHSPTLDSIVNWLPLLLTFLSPWITLHQLSVHLHQSMKPSFKRTNLCEVLPQPRPRHNIITIPYCLSLLCYGTLSCVPLIVAIWGASVCKLPYSLSTDDQPICLIFFFFFYWDDPSQHAWVSSIKLVFNSNDLSLHHFLGSYFQTQRRCSLWVLDQQFPNLTAC